MPLEIFERFDLEPLSKWVVFDEYALYDANLLIMFRRYVQFEEEDHVWIFISQNRQQFRLQSITAQKSNTATVSMTQAPWSRKSFTTHIVGCGYHRYFITKVWAASDHESALCGREHWSRLIPVGKYTSANRTGGPPPSRIHHTVGVCRRSITRSTHRAGRISARPRSGWVSFEHTTKTHATACQLQSPLHNADIITTQKSTTFLARIY